MGRPMDPALTTPEDFARSLIEAPAAQRPALLLRARGRLDEAEALARRLLARFKRAGEPAWAARVLVNLANVRHGQDRHAEAIRLLERARTALVSTGDRARLAAVEVNLANSWSLLAQFERS